MKTYKYMLLTSTILLVSFILSGCYYADLDYSSYEIDDYESADIEGVSEVEIGSVSSDIIILLEDTDEISASFTGTIRSTSSKVPKLKLEKHNGRILIEIDYPKNPIGLSDNDTTLYVHIPADYDNSCAINSVSGNIRIDELTMEHLYIETTSGDINCGFVLNEYLDLSSVSGEITINNCIAKKTKGDTVSGDIEISIPDDMALDLETSTVSGDIHTKDGHSEKDSQEMQMDLGTVSGDIRIDRF